MGFLNSRFFRVYLVPGFIFQSVIIGGGYGTGRELVEFFTQYGPLGGLLGMLITIIFFALVIVATYEFARLFKAYDYRTFFKKLLGPGFIAYEVFYILLLILVLAVMGSAAGSILQDYFNIPYAIGMAGMVILVGLLNFYGREIVTKTLAYWSIVLYAVFIIYFIVALSRFGGEISANLAQGEVLKGWGLGGFKYAFYNLAIVPAILFSVREIETRREAIGAGIISPFICMIPGLLFHLTFIGGYPEILGQQLPAYWMFGQLGITWLMIVYIIVLFGTFIETGAGFILGVIERIDAYLEETRGTTLSKPLRGVISAGSIVVAVILGTVGIVALIGKGYGTISWAFFFVYIVPVLTYGIYKILQQKKQESLSA
ncbi:MAG: hypothetical protein C4554_07510 [Dethiobacter sp.]|nr:MAG: hypothetical protein C4554_07510 [Dethiobacter sp.]